MIITLKDCDAWILSPDKPGFEAARRHSLREIAKYGINCNWFRAYDHERGRISASLSIMAICFNSLNNNKPLLLFEDDVTAWNPSDTFVVPNDTDLLKLGNSVSFILPDCLESGTDLCTYDDQ